MTQILRPLLAPGRISNPSSPALLFAIRFSWQPPIQHALIPHSRSQKLANKDGSSASSDLLNETTAYLTRAIHSQRHSTSMPASLWNSPSNHRTAQGELRYTQPQLMLLTHCFDFATIGYDYAGPEIGLGGIIGDQHNHADAKRKFG